MPMTMTDAARLSLQQTRPRAVMLWRALQPLRGLVRFMNTGAHPDDETSAMLAALGLRDAISLSYACSTRGEGGQNDLGREAGADLGTLRTAEMERACDVLNLSMYWLSDSPDDTITDFGFSKSGVETLGKWGHARALRRFAEIIRADRPDIICPTFLDIPGQHGHHRAMTQAAHEVMDAAADPAFDAAGAPWQVAKLYLPAWSGAGDAYDDDLPPPPETVRVPGHGVEAATGWTWAEIGQHSRVFHATQGMGRWVGGAETPGWPLHLARSFVGADAGGNAGAITDNLPRSYAELVPGGDAFAQLDAALADTVAAYPDADAVALAALNALRALNAARAACPTAAADQVLHRLSRHEAALARVVMLATGIRAEGRFAVDFARPGDAVAATVALHVPPGARVQARLDWDVPQGWRVAPQDGAEDGAADAGTGPNIASESGATGGGSARAHIHIPADAPAADPYPVYYAPGGAAGPVNLRLTLSADAVEARLTLPCERRLLVLPRVEASVSPAAVFVNARAAAPVALRLSDGAALTLPEGWALHAAAQGEAQHLTPPDHPAPGLWALPVTVAGTPAQTVTRIDYPHTGPRLRAAPAVVRLRVADVALKPARVGYIGGGNDRVDHWLRAMGADVGVLDDAALNPAALTRLDTLVIGIFALRFRPALAGLMPAIHDWVRAGGTLLTLYHRPWDNWDAARTAPAPLEIGKPSLRFRVTDEGAAVRHLAPDHPVLTGPNPIGASDWDGWVKERGLYFAKSWDAAYTPLLEMADPDEAPHRGALLSAEIGAGRHSHCALIVHLQMEALIPGAFRLMANMIAPR